LGFGDFHTKKNDDATAMAVSPVLIAVAREAMDSLLLLRGVGGALAPWTDQTHSPTCIFAAKRLKGTEYGTYDPAIAFPS